MYIKEKIDNFCVGLFIMVDSKHYFSQNFDVYKGNNRVNMDVHTRAGGLTKKPKFISNAIVKTQIINYLKGFRYKFLRNKYASPQLLAIMTYECTIRAVGTCRSNVIGF